MDCGARDLEVSQVLSPSGYTRPNVEWVDTSYTALDSMTLAGAMVAAAVGGSDNLVLLVSPIFLSLSVLWPIWTV